MDAAALDLRYLSALRVHWKRHKALPAMSKLAEAIGLKSAAGVLAVVGRLREAGYPERNDGRIAPTKEFLSYRLLGSVRAGVPPEVGQYDGFEFMNVEDCLITHPERTGFCAVRGGLDDRCWPAGRRYRRGRAQHAHQARRHRGRLG